MLKWVDGGVLSGTNPKIHDFLCIRAWQAICSFSCRNGEETVLRVGRQQSVKAWKAEDALDDAEQAGNIGQKTHCMSYLQQAAFDKVSPKITEFR